MAACLITVTGTSGVIRVNYTISATFYTIETSVGDFYIEDTATDVTYTTLSGDLVAASLCLTITELASTCYKINWTGLTAPGYKINQISLGAYNGVLSDITFPGSGTALVDAINGLATDSVKIIGYKIDIPLWTDPIDYSYSYILKVLGDYTPILRIRNADDSGNIYVYGVLQADCLPQTGYTIVDPCYNTLPPAP